MRGSFAAPSDRSTPNGSGLAGTTQQREEPIRHEQSSLQLLTGHSRNLDIYGYYVLDLKFDPLYRICSVEVHGL